MADITALSEFKHGVELLRNGYPLDALEYLRHASELEPRNAYYLSFLGVAMARGQKEWAAGAKLCETALQSRRNEAQLYLNLAEVYIATGRRKDAAILLEDGVKLCGPDARLVKLRGRLERRSSPVLPFLKRKHFLNRNLGKLRYAVSGHLQKS
jgi:Flp pilus assembly protein TadD